MVYAFDRRRSRRTSIVIPMPRTTLQATGIHGGRPSGTPASHGPCVGDMPRALGAAPRQPSIRR
jgi:hypothetical protein